MILYFNDYKLIYIITMMGKINNIPVLNEDVILLNEEIIGYIYPRRTSYVVALEIKPGRTTSLATSVNKQCMVLLSDKVRLATEQDFDDFHICFDGFRNSGSPLLYRLSRSHSRFVTCGREIGSMVCLQNRMACFYFPYCPLFPCFLAYP